MGAAIPLMQKDSLDGNRRSARGRGQRHNKAGISNLPKAEELCEAQNKTDEKIENFKVLF